MLRDLQFIGHFTYQVFPFFNLMSIPVIIIAHVPHLGSPHCVTVLEVLSKQIWLVLVVSLGSSGDVD